MTKITNNCFSYVTLGGFLRFLSGFVMQHGGQRQTRYLFHFNFDNGYKYDLNQEFGIYNLEYLLKCLLKSAILLFPVILYQMLEYSRESDRLVLYGDTVHDQQGRTVQGEEHGDAAGLGAVAVGGQRR